MSNWIVTSAIGATIATLALIAMALLPRPFTPIYHLSILLGAPRLGGDQLIAYKSYVSNNLTIDSIYLLAHSLMWLGISQMASRRTEYLGKVILVLGLSSAVLDLVENELRWAAMSTLVTGSLPELLYVFAFSFWLLFLAAIITGIGIVGTSRFGNILAVWSFIGVIAAVSIYKVGYLYSFFWLIVWHILCAYFLWSNRAAYKA